MRNIFLLLSIGVLTAIPFIADLTPFSAVSNNPQTFVAAVGAVDTKQSFLDTASLKTYCFFSGLFSSQNKYCAAGGVVSAPEPSATAVVKTVQDTIKPAETTSFANISDTVSRLIDEKLAVLRASITTSPQTVTITRYTSQKGEKGDKGDPGTTTIINTTTQGPNASLFGGGFANIPLPTWGGTGMGNGDVGNFTSLSSSNGIITNFLAGSATTTNINTVNLTVTGTATVPGFISASSSIDTLTLPTFTQGSIPFVGASGVISQDNANFFWDATNGRLGVGTTTPNQALTVNGSISLPNSTSSSTGVIYKGGVPFIHNYANPANTGLNTFVGVNSGNFTMQSGTSYFASLNTGVGANTLSSLTQGYWDTAVGHGALQNVTTGTNNVAMGGNVLNAFTTGDNNTAIGTGAMQTATSGLQNTSIGAYSLAALNNSGFSNTALGYFAGVNLASGSNNIIIGSQTTQTAGSGNLFIGGTTNASTTGSFQLNIGNAIYGTLTNNNIGIGSTTPLAKLSVKGTGTGTGLAFQTTGSTNIPGVTILDNANLGIGTTSPSQKLSIQDGAVYISSTATTDAGLSTFSARNDIGSAASMWMANSASAFHANSGFLYAPAWQIFADGNSGNGDINFYTNTVGNWVDVPKFTFASTGNMGIGTSTPFSKLSIQANVGETRTNLFTIASSSVATTTSLFTVLSNGTVGIGTSTPLFGQGSGASVSPLDIYTPGDTINNVMVRNPSTGVKSRAGVMLLADTASFLFQTYSSTNNQGLGFSNLTAPNFNDIRSINSSALAIRTTGNAAPIIFGTNALERLRLDGVGNIGIASTSPYAKLSIVSETTSTTTLAIRPISGQTANIIEIWNTNGTLGTVMTPTGSLGIGTTSPTSMLGVGGDIDTATQYRIAGTPVLRIPDINSIIVGQTINTFASSIGYNTVLGQGGALSSLTTGYSETAIGNSALASTTSGIQNTAVGVFSMKSNISSNFNTALGAFSFQNATSSGNGNTAIGFNAMRDFSVGTNNTAIGLNAMLGSVNSNAASNVAIGATSFNNITTGGSNVGLGVSVGSSLTSGASNVFLGASAGLGLTSGSNNISIGASSALASTTGSDQLTIGSLLYGTTINTVGSGLLGIGSTTPTARLGIKGVGTGTGFVFQTSGSTNIPGVTILDNGSLGIGTTSPATALQVFGDARVGNSGTNGCIQRFDGAALTGVCTSDANLKTNITYLGSLLDKVTQLKPATYSWNALAADKYKYSQNTTVTGLIAQDVEQIFPNLVATNSDGFKTVDSAPLAYYNLAALAELTQALGNPTSASTTAQSFSASTIFMKMLDALAYMGVVVEKGIVRVETLFAHRVVVQELCFDDGSVCLTKDQVVQILNQVNVAPAPVVVAPPATTSEPTPEVIIPAPLVIPGPTDQTPPPVVDTPPIDTPVTP